jgi:hypothetical protein
MNRVLILAVRRYSNNYEPNSDLALWQGCGGPRSTLLGSVQLLVKPHRREDHEKYARPDAQHARRND